MIALPFDLGELLAGLRGIFWPFLRLSALMLTAPVMSSASLPVRVRVLLAVFIAVLIAPLLPVPSGLDPLSAGGLLLAVREVAIGAAMGLTLQVAFAAVVIGGETLAMSMGLGFAMSIDPQNGVQVPVVSQFGLIMATLIFFAIDGHLLLFSVFADSFTLVPLANLELDRGLLMRVVLLAGGMYSSAIVLALPALTAVLMTNLAFGVITRAAPQLNIFAVGFPVTILVGFAFLLFGLPVFVSAVRNLLEAAFQHAVTVL
jgi:flagellar biosynthetic protein FliR